MTDAINKLVVVDADDWMGVYVNGKLAQEGHGASPVHLLAWAASFAPYEVELIMVEPSMEEFEELPVDLADLKVGKEAELRPELAVQ